MLTSLLTPRSSFRLHESLMLPGLPGTFPREADAAQFRSTQRPRPPAPTWPPQADARADDVLRAFERTGGLATGDELTFRVRRRTSQPISLVARWIVEQRVVSFGWKGDYLVPLFQFDPADMGVRGSVSAVLAEFDGTFDDWDLARWFALPNAWLAEDTPVDVLPHAPHHVLQAARADRFVARG